MLWLRQSMTSAVRSLCTDTAGNIGGHGHYDQNYLLHASSLRMQKRTSENRPDHAGLLCSDLARQFSDDRAERRSCRTAHQKSGRSTGKPQKLAQQRYFAFSSPDLPSPACRPGSGARNAAFSEFTVIAAIFAVAAVICFSFSLGSLIRHEPASCSAPASAAPTRLLQGSR